MTEAETRRKYIDKSLVKVGWKLEGNDKLVFWVRYYE